MFSKLISKSSISRRRNQLSLSVNFLSYRIAIRPSNLIQLHKRNGYDGIFHNLAIRLMCTSSGAQDGRRNPSESKKTDSSKTENKALLESEDFDDYEEPKTAGQKVAAYGMLTLRLGFILAALACVGITVRELFPGRMSPNALFNEAFEVVRENEEIVSIVGEEMRAFGRDVGRNTEGRRNHVESRSYVEADGSKRTRVRFYVKGPKGKVIVFAEVSNLSPSKEFAYLICQDARTGRVVSIQDNRASMALGASASSSEARDAMQSLLGQFSKK